MGQVFKMTNNVKRTVFGQKISHFLLVKNVGEKGEKKRAFKPFFRRSMEFCWSEFVELRTKVYCLNEGYTCILKMRDFTKDPKEEILGKSKFSSLRGVLKTSYHSTTLQEIEILPTLDYFHP